MSTIKIIHQITTMADRDGVQIPGRDRESYFYHINGVGAVEAWRTRQAFRPEDYGPYFGGVEVHYKHEPDASAHMAKHTFCYATSGPCWSEGSSLAFDGAQFYFGDIQRMAAFLEKWANQYLLSTEATA